jgi:ABC-type oligopeptide transport system ATPase subunit
MTSEPIVQLEDLRRSFTVRQKVGRLRRQTRVVHAVDGISASVQRGKPLATSERTVPGSPPRSRC